MHKDRRVDEPGRTNEVHADEQCRHRAAAASHGEDVEPRRAFAWRDGRWLAVLVVAAVAVRCIGIHQPLVGNFATKQAVYAMIARNWALDRAPFRQPTVDCLSDGVRAWHVMEWPATAFVTAWGWKLFGGSLDVWGRGVGVACSAAAVVLTYLLARRWFGETAARGAAFIVAFAPQSVAYGRGFLLEPSLAALSLSVVYAFDTWLLERKRIWLVVAALAMSIAVVGKIYMLLLVLPLGAMLVVRHDVHRNDWLFAAAVFAAAMSPTAAWYAWVASLPATSGPAADFHPLSRAVVHAWPHPLLTSPSFYGRVVRDLATVAFTPIGLLLFIVGLFDRRTRRVWPWAVATFALILALPLKFYAANYYYLILLPPVALIAGCGWQRLVERLGPGSVRPAIVALCGLLLAARYAVGPGFRIPDEDRSVTSAAAAVRRLDATAQPIATMHGSTIDLLYYCDRPGWALNVDDPDLLQRIDDAAQSGAERLVIADVAATQRNAAFTAWRNSCVVEASGDDWTIVRLDRASPASTAAAESTAVSRSRRAPHTATR